jgi:hypothetical protein
LTETDVEMSFAHCTIDEYLRQRLRPVEGTIPHVEGIGMYGNSIPAGTVGGDLFAYINFPQRYDIDARMQRARKRSKQYLEPLPAGATPRNSADDSVKWLKSRPGYQPEMLPPLRLSRRRLGAHDGLFSFQRYSAQSAWFAMVLSRLRRFAPGARRGGLCRHHGDDSIVGSKDQIVKIAGRDGPKYRHLLRGILVAEYV